MKKFIGIWFTVVAVFLLASSASAQIQAKTYNFSPFVGGYTFEGSENLRTRPVYGLRFGYDITSKWGVEGVLEFIRTQYANGSIPDKNADVYGYRVEALYYFMPESKLVPYLAVGLGGRSLRINDLSLDSNHFGADYGLGLKYFLYDNLAIRGDIRHIHLFNDNWDNLEYTVGLTYYFGGKKAPVPAAAPIDSDKDGVPDDRDKCPGTPAGVAVDQDGCPIDSDKDGVPDYLDKCPGTPAGVKVDQDGCPLDSDKDGVPDYLDKCPGTPAGVKVDKDGCPPVVEKPVVEKPVEQKPVEQKPKPVVPPVTKVEKEILEKGRATIDIEFDFDKAVVKPKYHDEIKKFADVMKKYPEFKVVIEGHTDSVGTEAYNQKLSERRATSVRNYMLKEFGIEESRLTAKGYGELKPIDSNKTAAGRQKNRRVEAAVNYMIKK